MNTRRNSKRRNDDGFTLVEILVVLGTMGIVLIGLTLIFITVIRTSPTAQARDDDARTLLGLTTYLPEDVNSTPPSGYDYGKYTPTGCSGASPGISLVQLTWTEDAGSIETFHASYRYIDSGNGYRIVRYTCRAGQTPVTNQMSSTLPDIDETAWSPGDEPVRVIPQQDAGVDKGLAFAVTTIAGDRIYLEMFSNNPANTLPPVPPGYYPIVPPGNQTPNAADIDVTTTPLTPVDIALPTSDPDGDGITITLSSLPAGWTTNLSGTVVTVTPPVTALPPTEISFTYTATDPYGQTATAQVEVEIVAVTVNAPPQASDYAGNAAAGVPLIIDLPAVDPDGDPLVTTLGSVHPSLTASVTGPTQITVTSDGTNLSPPKFTYTVSDGTATTSADVNLTVITCNVTSLVPSTTSVKRQPNGKLKNSVIYTVTYTGPCNNLVLEYDSDLSDGYQEVFLSFSSGTSVTLPGNPGGQSNWTVGPHTMTLRDSQTGPALGTATLTVTP